MHHTEEAGPRKKQAVPAADHVLNGKFVGRTGPTSLSTKRQVEAVEMFSTLMPVQPQRVVRVLETHL